MTLQEPPLVPTGSQAAAPLALARKAPDAETNKLLVASQWQLVWWKFRKHKLALVSAVVIGLVYLVALFVEPLAPYVSDSFNSKATYSPPQGLHVSVHDGEVSLPLCPLAWRGSCKGTPLSVMPAANCRTRLSVAQLATGDVSPPNAALSK